MRAQRLEIKLSSSVFDMILVTLVGQLDLMKILLLCSLSINHLPFEFIVCTLLQY